MPVCLCPGGRSINPELRGVDDPWAPSVDHIRELALGGADETWNMRAAHKRCNTGGAFLLNSSPRNRPWLREEPPLTSKIGDLFPQLSELARKLEVPEP